MQYLKVLPWTILFDQDDVLEHVRPGDVLPVYSSEALAAGRSSSSGALHYGFSSARDLRDR